MRIPWKLIGLAGLAGGGGTGGGGRHGRGGGAEEARAAALRTGRAARTPPPAPGRRADPPGLKLAPGGYTRADSRTAAALEWERARSPFLFFVSGRGASAHRRDGGMFWFSRNRFVGSYSSLSACSRSNLSP